MKFGTLLPAVIFIIVSLVYSQEYQTPESVVFDGATNSYFVSNYDGGNIIRIDSAGNSSYFKKGLTKLTGTVIYDNTLYVVENSKNVLGFDLAEDSIKFKYVIKEAKFLNDITHDNSGSLYITDIGLNKVYKIDLNSGSYSQLAETKSIAPNGIVYDKFNNRLLVCYFNENSDIDAISLEDTSITTVVSTGFGNLDGITIDAEANVYVSAFGTGNFEEGFEKDGKVYKYDSSFKNEPLVVLDNQNGPADIYFNTTKNELAVPLFLENKVFFLPLE